ncbi:MAG TPA: beta-ketoacyl-ACP reductase [Leptospiraceae bacterium]|nr:beta-ketoacyl-ACP reductase [Spirochaetaceae bacterium]HBS05892.1 beta-ketoacyl-ACP reductase [Leptospiraceae bacterium]|tara:strand:- start:805 stop:1557 length:753 start_codon:yes stop_codon:yes gene_type:complete
MVDLKGKAAVVTGSARGIGYAIADRLAELGADIIINDINDDAAKKAAEEIASSRGVKTGHFAGDISQQEPAEQLIETCISTLGKIDILVNNAGITKDTLLMRMKKEQWDAVIGVNLTGTYLCTQAAFKQMMKARSGSIVNISSIAGENGNPGQANYSASKAGVIGFTKTVALEGSSRGIRCNAIAPGFVKTDMTDAIPDKIRDEMVKKIPLGRAGEPLDIANGVAFLCSDMASFITAHVLDINGGGFRPE